MNYQEQIQFLQKITDLLSINTIIFSRDDVREITIQEAISLLKQEEDKGLLVKLIALIHDRLIKNIDIGVIFNTIKTTIRLRKFDEKMLPKSSLLIDLQSFKTLVESQQPFDQEKHLTGSSEKNQLMIEILEKIALLKKDNLKTFFTSLYGKQC